jgi:hypothetical protein
MRAAGVQMHSVFTLSQLLDVWSELGAVTEVQVAAVRAFLVRSREEA